MNTLPVSVWQNISAKLIPAVIYQVLSIIATFVAGLLFFIIGSNAAAGEIFDVAAPVLFIRSLLACQPRFACTYFDNRVSE